MGQHPCDRAAVGLANLEQRLQNGFAQSPPPVGRRHTNLVYPKLGRFVRVDIVHSGCEADDPPRIDGDRDMMPGIFEEFFGQLGVDRLVEYARSDVHQNGLVTSL
jgi:hypothetical protein